MACALLQTMRRVATLYIIRLCIPLILVLLLALLFFYVNDSYEQLNLSFNSLLVIALIAIEVKEFMPDHVIVVTWIGPRRRETATRGGANGKRRRDTARRRQRGTRRLPWTLDVDRRP